MQNTERQDVYTRITNTIVADLEKGVRPWLKPPRKSLCPTFLGGIAEFVNLNEAPLRGSY